MDSLYAMCHAKYFHIPLYLFSFQSNPMTWLCYACEGEENDGGKDNLSKAIQIGSGCGLVPETDFSAWLMLSPLKTKKWILPTT